MRWLAGITKSMAMNLDEPREMERIREAWCAADHGVAVGHDLASEQERHSFQLCHFCLEPS